MNLKELKNSMILLQIKKNCFLKLIKFLNNLISNKWSKVMPSKDELEAELRAIANKLEHPEDQLIRDLIEITVSQKHNSGTSVRSRRDFMEKKMNQFLIDKKGNSDES